MIFMSLYCVNYSVLHKSMKKKLHLFHKLIMYLLRKLIFFRINKK